MTQIWECIAALKDLMFLSIVPSLSLNPFGITRIAGDRAENEKFSFSALQRQRIKCQKHQNIHHNIYGRSVCRSFYHKDLAPAALL
jgi:hypothetical protein